MGGRKPPAASALGSITYQISRIVGFITGAAVAAVVNSYRTLGIYALTFGISAFILLTAASTAADHGETPHCVVGLVFGDPTRRTLLLFGWLDGFYILPEGLAASYVTWAADGRRAARLDSVARQAHRQPATLTAGAVTGA